MSKQIDDRLGGPLQASSRIDDALAASMSRIGGPDAPAGLVAAMRHAVYPGGARVRPRLCLAVAEACGDDQPEVAEAAATAIELLHCASLVHDDLPCFDDADERRGLPSVHVAFGERLAVLAGDALIVLAFATIGRVGEHAPTRVGPLIAAISGGVGMPAGIVAGQAWECESRIVLDDYQRAKTGALFTAATIAGAVAAGANGTAWSRLGSCLGEAYQVADDIRDVCAESAEIGKPIGRDAALGRPNAVGSLGLAGAVARLEGLVANAIDSIPDCAGAPRLRDLVLAEAQRLRPRKLERRVA
jgi:geranylgeranyl diphosphate synthase, type II